MSVLELQFASGETSLSVRKFTVREAVSELFTITIIARSTSPSIDLESIVGQPVSFRVVSGFVHARMGGARLWSGIVQSIEQVQAVTPQPGAIELSTYCIQIVPTLWLLTQRRNYRIYQHLSIPDIIDKLLGEWNIDPVWRIDRGKYPKLEYKVQYGESDFAFLSRLLEEAGIAYTFPDDDAKGSQVWFADKLEGNSPRPGGPLPYVDNPNQESEREFVSKVRLSHDVRPGAFTIRDHDFRNPSFKLFGEAPKAGAPEDKYEQYQYEPGGFLIETGKGGGTPVADDKGVARHDQPFGAKRAKERLEASRTGRRTVALETNTIDLWPGQIFTIDRHPHPEITADARLLVTEFRAEGTPEGEWTMSSRAVFTDVPYRPSVDTPKPKVEGVQTAVVVGPAGQEIHTDEFGRVRVQFPWDREGKLDDGSSCWIRVSQGWAGTGYGMIVIPRIGQEVLVGFYAGDPDRPVIVGRVFNAKQAVPYKLPDHKTRSTWKSDSSLGSGGFNEIMFEDLRGKELVWIQAQKNLRKLVKNDEFITVGHNRQKLVKNNETEYTGVDRVEVTGHDRTEITGNDRTTIIGAHSFKLVMADEMERTNGKLVTYIGDDQHIVVKQTRRERVEGNSHFHVEGKRNEKIDGSVSVIVGKDRHEKVKENHALEVGKEIHVKAGSALVLEAVQDLTLKGPGGFVRIDASGVTIKGTLIRINSGGSPGSGSGAKPEEPDVADEAAFEIPKAPEPDDVSVTGIRQ